jgi:iron complex outermembrane receptor protein
VRWDRERPAPTSIKRERAQVIQFECSLLGFRHLTDSLRGVGFYETTLAAYPDVSVYVDQVPLPFPVLTSNVGLDLERVEVLKGPQGILFGQNSTGGAINYIAAKPTDTFASGLDLSVGRFNEDRIEGYVSGP